MSGALSPGDRDRLEQLFEHAADLSAAEHGSFVARECADHPALAAELSRLLAALGGEDRLGAIQRGPTGAGRTGARIGPYQLEERVGEGGMGEVWAARQLEPVEGRVALKLIRPGLDSALIVARFEAEGRPSHACPTRT